MVVHPGAGHASGTIVNAALAHSPEMEGIGGEGRPGIVHRLDKDTSGILLLAKNDFTHRLLQEQFKQREIHKVYIALVDGRPPTLEGIIEGAIGRDPHHRKQMAVMHNDRGRDATSRYLTLKEFSNHTLLEIHPVTGRTHQIRLHLAFIGCPITGDRVYGYKKPSLDISRHFLHAEKITLQLPRTKLLRTFEAPLPGDLNLILDNLI
jgi:23S rRNA pseudouridine1911/1915/1917 synthase